MFSKVLAAIIYTLIQGKKKSEFLLVLLPFCTCPTVRQRQMFHLPFPNFLLGRTSGRMDSLDPADIDRSIGDIGLYFLPCLSLCLSTKNFNTGHNF